jgi:hypothetical protein
MSRESNADEETTIMEHHTGLDAGTVAAGLWRAVELWERGGCDCCSPNPLEDALEDLTVEQADRLRKFGIEVASTGQWAIERDAEYQDVTEAQITRGPE